MSIWRDLWFAIRLHARTPAVTLAAVVTLALGVGANTVMFSFADALLLRPLPIRNPDRVVALFHVDRNNPSRYSSFSHPDYVDLRDGNTTLAGLAAYSSLPVDTGEGDALERLDAEIISHNYFDVLGLAPAFGRWFTEDEDRTPGTHPVAIISHALWTRRYGTSPDAIGSALVLNGRSFTIVGVAPTTVRDLAVYRSTDVWVPLMMHGTVLPSMNAAGRSRFDNRTTHWLDLVGRLHDDASLRLAQAQLDAMAERLTREVREVDPSWEWVVRAVPLSDSRLGPPVDRPIVRLTWLLSAVVGLVLVIACANVANLLLARAFARRREIGIRLAIGAGRRALVRQLLVESLVLTAAAGAVGVLAGSWVLRMAGAFDLESFLPGLAMRVDGRVLAFTLALTAATGIAFGLLPALQGSRVDVVPALKDGPQSMRGATRRSHLRQILVAGQVALCAVLLIGAGLALRTLANLYAVPLGFDVDEVSVASLDLGPAGLSREAGLSAHRRLAEALTARAGVEAVSLALVTPFSGRRMARDLLWERGPSGPRGRTNVDINVVGPQYFEAMGIPIFRGRAFTWEDRTGAPDVAIANAALAARLWPGQEAVGQRLWLGNLRGADVPLEVIGVAGDGRYAGGWRSGTRPFLFLPSGQMYSSTLSLIVRTSVPSALTPADIGREVRAVAPGALVVRVEPLRVAMRHAVVLERMGARLLGLFGFLAITLAAVGIYGVVSLSVTARTREMGVRLALGAPRGAVARMILWNGMAPVLVGTGVGLAAALALSHVITALLFGVAPTDPMTFAGVAAVLLGAAAVASAIPARRATRVDPVAALRAE